MGAHYTPLEDIHSLVESLAHIYFLAFDFCQFSYILEHLPLKLCPHSLYLPLSSWCWDSHFLWQIHCIVHVYGG